MKIKVTVDEDYPVYWIGETESPFAREIELTQEEYDFITRAYAQYDKASAIISDKLRGK